MEIGIIGGGSLGLLYAFYLAKTNKITVYTRTEEQAKKISLEGIVVVKDHKQEVCSVHALPFSNWNGTEDLIIVTVKQYQLSNIIVELAKKRTVKKSSILFLQNGMSHVNLLNKLSNWNIFLGTVEHGAYRLNVNTVKHTGLGKTRVAIYQGEVELLLQLLHHSDKSFPFIFEKNYETMLTKKLVANAVINPLTAVLNVRNGELIENPQYYQVLTSLFFEFCKVLNLENEEKWLKHIMYICKSTAKNQSSMLKDVLEGRQTEVDAILGYLLTEARKKQIEAPLINTFYLLVKGKSGPSK
ncbi:2-dehydropantoate 2-reductase [Bacillus aquiflavi]|uniref:2-dehydropantoate 2-reductase n=1 Tax=Bacillus aquiflavi TaxID=2672567 RepID=UPI001CA7F423|nr:2-dehydropantoate 2-reductase [Bacillus aquiflavi]UAC49300.1 2-dehydropantoate 2-reductase [Bacillus aquiflavi]